MLMLRVLLCVVLLAIIAPEGSEAWRRFRLWRIIIRPIRRWVRKETLPVTAPLCDKIEKSVVTRDQWKAIESRDEVALDGIADKVVVHQTGADTCRVMGLSGANCQRCLQDESCIKELILALQNEDLENGKSDIGYNFLIDQDGVIYEGRGWNVVGQHTPEVDKTSIGVAILGDFSKSEPNLLIQTALRNLLMCGQANSLLSRHASLVTEPEISGRAVDEMVRRCQGLCVA